MIRIMIHVSLILPNTAYWYRHLTILCGIVTPRRHWYRHVLYRDTYRGIAGIAQHYTVSQKSHRFYFCDIFVKFHPILLIFGRNMPQEI